MARADRSAKARAGRGEGSAAHPTSVVPLRSVGWEKRLYEGLQIAAVPSETRASLIQALGELGVEAEHLLGLVETFPGEAGASEGAGEQFLAQLEAFAHRVVQLATPLEVATQGYLTALAAAFPELRSAGDEGEPWWPAFAGYTLSGEPLELRLRRCGFAYRHVVAVRLSATLEALAEQMALALHALGTLPPAGIVPASALYRGLYELSSALHGYVVAHHIADLNERTPGLLNGIARLRELTRREDTALEADIAWARTQYAFVRDLTTRDAGDARPGADGALREWRETITALERLRSSLPNTPAR
jgi:hypothetical protein